MFTKKILISALTALTLLSTFSFAKQNEDKAYKKEFKEHKKYKEQKEYKENKEHKVKQKNLPYGLQKKVNNGGTLPPGWQKKLKRGEIVDQEVLNSGVVIYNKNYPDIKDTKIYKVQDRIFRVAQNTRELLEILK